MRYSRFSRLLTVLASILWGLLSWENLIAAPAAPGYYPPYTPYVMPATQPGNPTQAPGWPPARQYRPMPSTSYSGTPPSQPPYGTQYYYQFQYRSNPTRDKHQGRSPLPTPTQTAPSIETSVSERRPVIQQNLIYRVRIKSSGNLKEAAPRPPDSEAAVFRQLGQPVSFSEGQGGKSALITEYTYLLIPLKEGEIYLPGITLSGKYTNGAEFNVTAEHGITLYVQPAEPGVQPWLPLYNLRLDAKLPEIRGLKAGEPLEMSITTSAVGAVGTQLPGIAAQLQSDDFYIYPGEVSTSGRISADGLDLVGSRTENFTLVPRWGGTLNLPSLSLQWWNLRTGKAASATLPIRQIQVAGPPNPNGDSRAGFNLPEGASLWFWIPLVLVILLLLFAWLKVLFGAGRNPVASWVAEHSQQLLGELYQPLAALGRRLSPRRHMHRLRSWIGRNLPISWKLWYCLRALEKEDDPSTWVPALQILAAKHLGVRRHADLQSLGRSIIACHPAANPQQVQALMAELDRAVYGGQKLDSFRNWKADFKRQIKPRLFPIRFRSCRESKDNHLLPQLNPGSSHH
ncbi:BatD family protein [Thiolapillus sp.]